MTAHLLHLRGAHAAAVRGSKSSGCDGGVQHACLQARGPCGFWWVRSDGCGSFSEPGRSVTDVSIRASHPRQSGIMGAYWRSSSQINR